MVCKYDYHLKIKDELHKFIRLHFPTALFQGQEYFKSLSFLLTILRENFLPSTRKSFIHTRNSLLTLYILLNSIQTLKFVL